MAQDLITLAILKDHLGIPVAVVDFDTRLTRLVGVISERIRRECNRADFGAHAVVEYHDGRSQQDLVLREYPVNSITEIRYDVSRVFGADTILDADRYALIDNGVVRFHNGYAGNASQMLMVTYSAGYATIPADLEYAALMFAEWLHNHRNDQRIGMASKGKSQETISFREGIPKEILAMLDPYRSITVWPEIPTGNV